MKPEVKTLKGMVPDPRVAAHEPLPGRPRVLYAGSEEPQHRPVAEWLRSAGYEAVSAANGVAALASLAQARPAAVILEADLPSLDGFRLCALVKAHAVYRGIPVIILSAHSSAFGRAEANIVGADAFLAEPREDVFVATVGRLLAPQASQTIP